MGFSIGASKEDLNTNQRCLEKEIRLRLRRSLKNPRNPKIMFQVPEHTPSNRHGTWTRTIKTRISRKEEQKAPIEAYITPHTNDNELILSAFTC